MNTSDALTAAKTLLQPWTQVETHPETNRMDIILAAGSLKPAVAALLEARWGYLSAITGLDHPGSLVPQPEEKQWDRLAGEAEQITTPPLGSMEALYHFCEGNAVVTLRVKVPYTHLVLPTVCDLIPSASLYEREMIEMLGLEFVGTPSTDRLLLPDDWPDGVYPLRKSFTGFSKSEEK